MCLGIALLSILVVVADGYGIAPPAARHACIPGSGDRIDLSRNLVNDRVPFIDKVRYCVMGDGSRVRHEQQRKRRLPLVVRRLQVDVMIENKSALLVKADATLLYFGMRRLHFQ